MKCAKISETPSEKIKRLRELQDEKTREAQVKGVTAVFPGGRRGDLLPLFTKGCGTNWQKTNIHGAVAIRFVPFPDDLVIPLAAFIVVHDGKRFTTQYLTARASLDKLDELSSLPDWYSELGI